MNIFQKFALVNKVSKAVKEIKLVIAANSEIADKIKEVIDDLIKVLEKIKALVPAIDDAVCTIIEIIKKWFKK